MPRPTRAYGRPGTRVIPSEWGPSHAVVVAKTLTGTCTIRHPGGTRGDFDETTGTYPTTPYPAHYDGGCRVQALSTEERSALFAEEPITTVGYRVVVDLEDSAGVKVDDLVKVSAVDDNGDATLVGRTLTVQSWTRGTLMWERDLICVESQDHVTKKSGG